MGKRTKSVHRADAPESFRQLPTNLCDTIAVVSFHSIDININFVSVAGRSSTEAVFTLIALSSLSFIASNDRLSIYCADK
jgi:hypothetical protein